MDEFVVLEIVRYAQVSELQHPLPRIESLQISMGLPKNKK